MRQAYDILTKTKKLIPIVQVSIVQNDNTHYTLPPHVS